MRVTKDGKAIGTHNDGTVKKAGVGIYEITFSTGPTGGKLPLDLGECAVFATPRVEHESTPEEVSADLDVQRLDGARIFVESTRPVPFSDNKITPFLTNVSFDVAAICCGAEAWGADSSCERPAARRRLLTRRVGTGRSPRSGPRGPSRTSRNIRGLRPW